MKTFKMFFQLLRRCLLGLFIAYWVVFVSYTAGSFLQAVQERSSGGTSILTHRSSIEAMGGFLRNGVGEILGWPVRNPRHHFGAVFRRTAVEADATKSGLPTSR
jgi:hypothetical protein